MEQNIVDKLVVDVHTEKAIMFKPVGENVKLPQFLRIKADVFVLVCQDPDGRASYVRR